MAGQPTLAVHISLTLRPKSVYSNLAEELLVFNIAGNAYRLITVIHFNTGRVYVRRVLTHAAYTRGTWQDD